MVALYSLWFPILLSGVLVFVASSIIHMATSWHKHDFVTTPNEQKVMDSLRPFAIPPGDYVMPHAADMAEMKSTQFQDKLKKGPVMVFTVMPNGPFSMGRSLTQWFIYSVVVSFFAAYVTVASLPAGTAYLRVFQVTGAVAFIGYSLALWQMSIWYHRSWATTVRITIDGLIYGLLTAGAFGWLWPR